MIPSTTGKKKKKDSKNHTKYLPVFADGLWTRHSTLIQAYLEFGNQPEMKI